MSIAYNTSIVRDGLVLCLDAANKKSYPGSGTVWKDLSGNGNDGAVSGATYSLDGGFYFDGTDDVVKVNTPTSANEPQTYEIWTNAKASPSGANKWGYLIHNNASNNYVGYSFITIGVAPSQEYIGCFDGEFNIMRSGVVANGIDVVCLTLVWDGAEQLLYANGELKTSNPLTTAPLNRSSITSLGDYITPYRQIIGDIKLVRSYNRALSEQEIRQNFNATRGRYGI